MPHFAIPTKRHSDIAAIRLSTRSALARPTPSAEVPEAPRSQYDTMKAYDRLEKSGAIASLESLQQNVRPLFAYPRKDFETPRKRHVQSSIESSQPLLSSSLVDTSDLYDSILTSSVKSERPFASSPRTSLDFSSSLPYPSEQEIWVSSPPVRGPTHKDMGSSSRSTRYRLSALSESELPASSSPLEHKIWSSSPHSHATRMSDTPFSSLSKRRSPNSLTLQYLPSSPPESIPTSSSRPKTRRSSREPAVSHQPINDSSSSRSRGTTVRHRHQHARQISSPPTERYTTFLEDISEDAQSIIGYRQRGRTSLRTSSPCPEMRYTTVLEDVFHNVRQSTDEGARLPSRRSRLSLRVERAVGWILRR